MDQLTLSSASSEKGAEKELEDLSGITKPRLGPHRSLKLATTPPPSSSSESGEGSPPKPTSKSSTPQRKGPHHRTNLGTTQPLRSHAMPMHTARNGQVAQSSNRPYKFGKQYPGHRRTEGMNHYRTGQVARSTLRNTQPARLSATPNRTHPDTGSWEGVSIRVDNFPNCNALTVHRVLFEFGHINHINCGPRNALVRFSFYRPALFEHPVIPGERSLFFEICPKQPETMASAADPRKITSKKVVVPVTRIDFGVLTAERRMMPMHTVATTVDHPATLMLDLYGEKRKSLNVFFFLTSEQDAPWYRLEIRLNSPVSILQLLHDDGHKELVITSLYPPKWWRSVKSDELEEIHQHENVCYTSNYSDWPRGWRRVTDIDLDPEEREREPVSFVRPSPVIDTGRWLTWRLTFPADIPSKNYDAIIGMLRDHNVRYEEVSASRFEMIPREDPIIWQHLDPHLTSHESDLYEMQDGMMHLDQDVRYQLEVCISNNKINEYNMDKDFLHKLGSMERGRALLLLENVADSKRIFFDPMDIFTTSDLRYSRKRRIPSGCVLMRTAIITPTTVYVRTPTVEVSNRVIRENDVAKANFLRIKFEDEEIFGGLNAIHPYDNQHEVWLRLERCLRHGIMIAGRHYEFLASGNSQFREAGAYFFARHDVRTADNIRLSLGDFSPINIVAKYWARIGQCFSTTRAFTNVGQVEVQKIDDIERNGLCFTDGVGKISPFLAQMIAHQFGIPTGPSDLPSVFQFRMGGYKGVLGVDPSLKGRVVQVRPSQHKFDAPSNGLEIIRVSSFSSSTLNQQIILILTALGIPKQVFIDKMVQELRDIDLAMTDEMTALTMLQKNVDFNQVTLSISEMIMDGFLATEEPFVQAVMELWRAWSLKHLKEKAKIPIEKGAFVFGCVDETNTLRMDKGDIPEIFIQVPGENNGEWKSIEGICLLARNPSLHPGDIRVVRAVDCPQLKHLKNVVALPQQGQRPLANMCSGGDLDGDDYLVMWDEALLPSEKNWNRLAMDYTSPTPVMCAGPVKVEHFIEFFVNYIKYNNLGSIAICHRALADYFETNGGVNHPICLELAQAHSRAVDHNKTGVPAMMREEHWPQKYPHFIPGKPESRQYKSRGVLGNLFDMVQRVRFNPLLDKPFDKRILDAYHHTEDTLTTARAIKREYDRDIRRVMAQHDIKTEFEVWTAFIMDHNREKHWYSLAEEMGRLMTAIKTHYQETVRKAVGIKEYDTSTSAEVFAKLGPFVAAMYTVTAQEVAEWKESKLIPIGEESDEGRPLISFPWLFARELGKIATRDSGSRMEKFVAAGLGEVRRRAPKPRYEAELHQLDLEPVREWTGEISTTVGDLSAVVSNFPVAEVERKVNDSGDHEAKNDHEKDDSEEREQEEAESIMTDVKSIEDRRNEVETDMRAGAEALDENEDGDIVGENEDGDIVEEIEDGEMIEENEEEDGPQESLLDRLSALMRS